MPCLIVLIALFCPRILLFFIWLLTSVPKEVFSGWFWPFMGFLFMPFTTLAYEGAIYWAGGTGTFWGIILIVLGILCDLGFVFADTESSTHKVISTFRAKP